MIFQTSAHYDRVRDFMTRAKQDCPTTPTIPSAKTRILRAKLMMEEVLETIAGLGVSVSVNANGSMAESNTIEVGITNGVCHFHDNGIVDMVEVADGCADVAVVTTGTLIAIGVADLALQAAVDKNNNDKFGPGHSWNEAGKLLKPPGHKPPDIASILKAQGWTG